MRNLLGDFDDAPILSFGVADGEVADMDDWAVLSLDPEFRHFLRPLLESPDDLVDDMEAFRGMAVLDVAADDGRASGENSLFSLGVIEDPVVFVDKGDIQREMTEHEIDLLRGKAPF
jgi:hypothetical protein